MHLDVIQSGGFTGLIRQWSAEVPDEECGPFLEELEAAERDGRRRPDERTYAIRLGTASATVAERQLRSGSLASLVARARDRTREQ